MICTNDICVLNSSQAMGLSDHRVQLVDFDVPTEQHESRVCGRHGAKYFGTCT